MIKKIFTGISLTYSLFFFAQTKSMGINTISTSATLDIVSTGNTSATKALEVNNSSATEMLTVLNNGNVGIGVPAPAKRLDANANNDVIRLQNLTTANNVAQNIGLNYYLAYDPATGNVQAKVNNVKAKPEIAAGASATITEDTNSNQGTFLIRTSDTCGASMTAYFVYSRRGIGFMGAIASNGSQPTVTTSGSYTYNLTFSAPSCGDGSNSTQFNFSITKPAYNQVTITNNGNIGKAYLVVFTPAQE